MLRNTSTVTYKVHGEEVTILDVSLVVVLSGRWLFKRFECLLLEYTNALEQLSHNN